MVLWTLNSSKFLIIVFVLLCGLLNAQDSRFFLETDRTEISEGETFILTVVLDNVDGKNLQLPDLAPFKIVQGPSTSTSVTIINGKRSATQSYQYLLLTTKKGKFTIGSATIQTGSKIIRSNSLTLNVGSGQSQNLSFPSNITAETFVRLEAKDTKAYVGQQLVLNLVLYTRSNIESFQLLNEPSFEGFYAQPVNDIRDQPRTVNIKGKEYYAQVVRRWALFPQKTGIYTLGPVNCNLDVAIENGQSSFFFRDTKKETVISNNLKFNIQNLPVPSPEAFTGAVGNFTMNAQIKKSTVITGEGLTIQMQIEGDGDSRIVQAPAFELPDGFEQYSPATIKDETYQSGDRIMMKKEFEYILVPSKDSTYSITPVFSYFDISSDTYKTISSAPFTVNVVKGDNHGQKLSAKETTEDFSKLSDDDSFYNTKGGFFGSFRYVMALGFIILMFAVMLFYKHHKSKMITSAEFDKKYTSDFVKNSLLKAEKYLHDNKQELFYEEISEVLLSYIQKKFSIPNIKADKDAIITLLEQKAIPPQLVSEFNVIYHQCELARFAGVYGDMHSILKKSDDWFRELEKLA